MSEAYKVVFGDEYLLVADKKAKILVQPSPKKEKITLTSLIKEELRAEVFPCHRLDRETTGLIIYAKDKNIQKNIMDQFKKRKVEKKYVAFIEGALEKNKGMLKGFVQDKEAKRFGEKPKEAKTFYRVRDKFTNWSVIELQPVTGRTNQLRIQLVRAGCPILGEDKYAFRRNFSVKFKRLALHAFYLSFMHPVSRDRVEVKIALAADMKNYLDSKKY